MNLLGNRPLYEIAILILTFVDMPIDPDTAEMAIASMVWHTTEYGLEMAF